MPKLDSDNIVLMFGAVAFCGLTIMSEEAFGLNSNSTTLCRIMAAITMLILFLNIIINSKDLRD